VKIKLRSLIVIAMTVAMAITSQARGTSDEEESLGEKIKHFFARPTPTPKPGEKSIPADEEETTPTPSPSPKASRSPSPKAKVHPAPATRVSSSPSATASPEASATPSVEPSPLTTPSPTPSSTPDTLTSTLPNPKAVRPISPAPHAKPSPVAKPISAPNATISPAEISGYENYSPEVRKIIDLALSLTTMNLGYKYGSADPANGGMDCSGFIYYALSRCGIQEVPRDAREQYIWVRKAGNFQAVLAHRDDTFELDALRPGDLLFWSSTYSVNRDPAITYTMIYLGREKETNRRIMVGASDGRTYKGQSRVGVGVFDFKVSPSKATEDNRTGPAFVGYARIPGLPGG
jgi:cell wall-associated NlpC family hydrolase